jgi:catechol 2,3-dioxygenase-like lactoylglutathione lyase family enzyme
MTAKGVFYVFAWVSDLERSKRFYGETLGWKLGTDEKDVAGFSVGSAYLVIHTDNRSEQPRRYPGGMHVAIQVDDVDAEHARLKQLGLEVGEPCDQPWGERNFSFADPDGSRAASSERRSARVQLRIAAEDPFLVERHPPVGRQTGCDARPRRQRGVPRLAAVEIAFAEPSKG